MRRVLHLINTAGPGGAETVFLGLVKGLDRDRWRSVTVVPEVDWLTTELRAAGHNPILDAAHHRLDFGFFRRMGRLIRTEGIDVIHSHLFGPTVEAAILGLLTGVPVVGTIHGVGDLAPDEGMRRLKFAFLRHGLARLVFVSESLRDSFLEQCALPRSLTAVIPNGVDTSLHVGVDRHATRRELGVPPNRFLVGAVGNLRTVKRYDVLLEAAALLRQRSRDYSFVVVGQTPRELHQELLALRRSLGLEDCVQFTGFRPDVERLMAAFDLFAISSDSEGFSIATVQAMAAGLPVVATRCGGPEEILDNPRTGMLVPTGSPAQLADAVECLRGDPQRRRKMGAEAQTAAAERFSLDAQLARYASLYEQVIGERSSPERATSRESPPRAATRSATPASRLSD